MVSLLRCRGVSSEIWIWICILEDEIFIPARARDALRFGGMLLAIFF